MTNLYNLMHGINKATFFFMPMLGLHPDEYPRFRDCFLGDEENPKYNDFIHVYMQIGGGNRPYHVEQIKDLREMPQYVTDFDDPDSITHATFIYSIPEEWIEDFKLLKEVKLTEVSDAYYSRLCEVYKEIIPDFQEAFGRSN